MHGIRLWTLDDSEQPPRAEPVESIHSVSAEAILEDLLVASPQLLEPGLRLVGRQLPTVNGPLDLVGVDRNGRLVVYELKRGTLARDAVAQVIDYASDLAVMDRDDLARHIAERSGSCGVDRIPDFDAWYEEHFPDNVDEFSLSPRLVLVGLGIDPRTLRMVRFLADAGVEIDVITFHAFQRNGCTLLARLVEVSGEPGRKYRSTRGSWTQAALEEDIAQEVDKRGISDLFAEVREFVREHIGSRGGGAPNRSGVTFYRPAYAEDPNGPGRSYAGLNIDPEQKDGLVLVFTYRAVREGGQVMVEFLQLHNARKTTHSTQGYEQYELRIDRQRWPEIEDDLRAALNATNAGVAEAERAAQEAS